MTQKRRIKRTGGMERLYGIHAVREAVLAGRRQIHQLYVEEKRNLKRVRELIEWARSNQIPCQYLPSESMRTLFKTDHHQGIGAKVSPYPPVDVDRLLVGGEADTLLPFLLLIDSVVDPQNLGGLIRTAACVGIQGVVIPKDRAAFPTPSVSKASAGALEHMRVAMVTNLARTMIRLKDRGIWMVGLDPRAGTSIFACDIPGPVALVVGGEEKGIRPLVQKQCDLLVSIPQTGRIDSLNASAAGAVAMYEIYRQRRYG